MSLFRFTVGDANVSGFAVLVKELAYYDDLLPCVVVLMIFNFLQQVYPTFMTPGSTDMRVPITSP